MLMGRMLKTTLPIKSELLKSHKTDEYRQMLVVKQSKEESRYNVGAKDMEALPVGQRVRFRLNGHWVGPGVITEKLDFPRSYLISWNDKNYRRNRRHILKTKEISKPQFQLDPIDEDTFEVNLPVPDVGVTYRHRLRDRTQITPPNRLIEEM